MLAVPVLLLCACSSEESWEDLLPQEDRQAQQYINLTVTVSSDGRQTPTRAAGGDVRASAESSPVSDAPVAGVTRAPQGGEDGDGRENRFDRENAITGITFILADGPLGSATAKIAFIQYYPVSEATADYAEDGHGHTDSDIEKKYTTGDQLVSSDELDMTVSKEYNVYVVANRRIEASKGDNLSTIKDKTLTANELFTGYGYAPDGCMNFVMASDQEATVNFASTAPDGDIDKTTAASAEYYRLRKPIVIERLAARLDFCTAYSSNSKNAAYGSHSVYVGGTLTTVTGYRYDIGTEGNGFFVLESITPFNIYNEQQHLFERTATGWTVTGGAYSAAGVTYLGKETAANYIVDPHTAEKVSKTLSYQSRLAVAMPTAWRRTAASLNGQSESGKTKVVSTTGYDNFVLAYCMENTLMPGSPLKDYATGLVITGSYYDKDRNFQTRKSFYEYLRHQDTGTTYSPKELTADNLADDDRTGESTVPMNFSIVRNNIYRVNIEEIAPDKTLKIKVKMWDPYRHDIIYM